MQKTLLILAMLTLPLASVALIELAFAAPPASEAETTTQQASAPQAELPDAAPLRDSSMPQPAGQQ